MKLTIVPTNETVRIEGQDFRIWEGTDEEGVPVRAIVRAVSPQTDDKQVEARFAERLSELPPLKTAGMVIDHRFVVD